MLKITIPNPSRPSTVYELSYEFIYGDVGSLWIRKKIGKRDGKAVEFDHQKFYDALSKLYKDSL